MAGMELAIVGPGGAPLPYVLIALGAVIGAWLFFKWQDRRK